MFRVTYFLGIERDGDGKQLPADIRANGLQAARRIVADVFGGYSMSHCAGGWTNPEGVLIEEGAVKIVCYLDAQPQPGIVQRTAARIGAELNQSSVLAETTRVSAAYVTAERAKVAA